jgi:hypothetical protein
MPNITISLDEDILLSFENLEVVIVTPDMIKEAVDCGVINLARIFHESLATTTDMAVLPGVLGCRLLRRTVQVRLETNTLRLPGGTPILVVSRQQFMKYPG